MKPTYRYLTALLCLILIHTSFAQEKLSFEKIGVEEGLPEEFARQIIQDQQGFIWVGTQNGLVKYDGYDFKIYGLNHDPKIPVRNIVSLNKLKNGHIVIGSFGPNTIAVYDPVRDKTIRYRDSIQDLVIASGFILEDSEKNLWFRHDLPDSTFLGRLNVQKSTFHYYPYRSSGNYNEIVGNFRMQQVNADSGTWLLGAYNSELHANQLRRYNREVDEFDLIYTHKDSLADLQVNRQGDMLFLTNGQFVHLFDPVKRKIVKSYRYTNREFLLDYSGSTFEDDHGILWCSARETLTRINTQNDSIQMLNFGTGLLAFPGAPTRVSAIMPIMSDLNELWFAIRDYEGQTYFLNYLHSSGRFSFYTYQFNNPKNPIYRISTSPKMLKDYTNLHWIATRPNLYKESPKSNGIELFRGEKNDPTSIPNDTIGSILEDSRKRIWIGTINGLAVTKDGKHFTHFYHDPTTKNSLSGTMSRQIVEDRSGTIWVLTNKGLDRYNEASNDFETVFRKNQDLKTTILVDNQNYLWIFYSNDGLYKFKDGKLIHRYIPGEPGNNGFTGRFIFNIYEDTDGEIWFSDHSNTDQGIFRYSHKTDSMTHYSYNPEDSSSVSSNEIFYITQDGSGKIWVGTDGGLNSFNKKTNSFTRYEKGGAMVRSTAGYAMDKMGKMWFGSYSGGGLLHDNPETNSIVSYGESRGLLHNDITVLGKIPVDDQNRIYLPTQRGLSVYDIDKGKFINFRPGSGFDVTSRGYITFKDSNEQIWIGGMNGLYKIDPDLLFQEDQIAPEVYITNVSIGDSLFNEPDGEIFTKAISYTDTIELAYWQKDLSFGFVALHYLNSKENQYSWKLENYDQEWSEPSTERKATYTNLSPGEYTFWVKGANPDGVWNEKGDTIRVIIHFPFWQTPIAFVIYFLVFCAVIFAVHRIQKSRTIQKERERIKDQELEQAKKVEEAYEELKSTQQQLIHSEKMASLGELTAGIAHEIQNPLNFVNNFADINREMIDEQIEELDAGNLDEVRSIANDIKSNEEKIIHHGKRAEDIVKSMLQHSRGSEGKKELIDINALADEYLRLSYHGLRAKDKSFNADFKVETDNSLPKISVVPQDIGRVLLNLINNAFFATTEKAKANQNGYKPVVQVITSKKGNQVEIIVKDNGSGIPESIKDKIFQPFFTTKGTGSGTGLGLSLSYDIIRKGHDGNIVVESVEGEGTSFKIHIPIK